MNIIKISSITSISTFLLLPYEANGNQLRLIDEATRPITSVLRRAASVVRSVPKSNLHTMAKNNTIITDIENPVKVNRNHLLNKTTLQTDTYNKPVQSTPLIQSFQPSYNNQKIIFSTAPSTVGGTEGLSEDTNGHVASTSLDKESLSLASALSEIEEKLGIKNTSATNNDLIDDINTLDPSKRGKISESTSLKNMVDFMRNNCLTTLEEIKWETVKKCVDDVLNLTDELFSDNSLKRSYYFREKLENLLHGVYREIKIMKKSMENSTEKKLNEDTLKKILLVQKELSLFERNVNHVVYE